MQQLLAFLFAPFFLFCKAAPPEIVPPDYLITAITVTCQDTSSAPVTVTDPQVMEKILEYLRTVPLRGQADTDSMDASLPLYTVRLTHITGRVTEYHQRGMEYISKGNRPWYHIDSEDGRFLIAFFPNTLYNNQKILSPKR